MTLASIGMIAGLLLGVAAAAGGFVGFLIALVLGAAGFLVGGQLGGDLDLGQVVSRRDRG